MNPTSATIPPTVRARIHESAVRPVTRIYAATLADIFAENSRQMLYPDIQLV